MSQTYFRFGKAPFGSNKTDECLTDDIEEEDEYDALNDETFGDGAFDGNWEDNHEKLSGFVYGDRRHLSSKNQSHYLSFDEELDEDLDEKLGRSKEIVEQTISHLGLEDDLDDPAVMSRGRSEYPPRSIESVFGPSAAPPAILDAEEYGSPKTQSIWSTNMTLSSTPPQDNHIGSLLQNLKVQSGNVSHLNNLHEIPPFTGINISPKQPLSSAHKLEDIERDLLGESDRFGWTRSPKTMTAEQVERDLLGGPSIFGQSFTDNLKKNTWTSPSSSSSMTTSQSKGHWTSTPPLPISGGIRTLDDVENDILLKPRARTLDEIERGMRGNVAPPPGFSVPSGGVINRQPPIGTPPQGGSSFPTSHHLRSSPVPIAGRTSPIVMPHPMVGTQISTSLPPHPILNPGGHASFGNFNKNPFPFNVRGGLGGNVNPALLKQNYPPHGWNYTQRRDQLQQNYRSRDLDSYEGIMTQREKEWLIKIQMLQLHTDNPYVDDYYHTTYIMRKMTREKSKSIGEDDDNELKLVVPERSKQESKTYVPLQFEGSLGKLQAVSVNFPRRILDVNHMSTEEESRMPANKELHKQRRLLLDIEKLYTTFLNIDDEEKRISALPEEAQVSHVENRNLLIERLFSGLCCVNTTDERFVQIASIRKGRHLILRSIPLFSMEQQMSVYAALYGNIGFVTRRDQSDQVLPQYLGMVKKMIVQCTFEELVTLGRSLQGELNEPFRSISCPSREWNIYLAAFQTKFLLSSLCNMINRAEQIMKEDDSPIRNDLQSHWTNFILHIVDALCSMKDGALKPPDSPPINILQHIRRFSVTEDKMETLKSQLKLFGYD